MQPLHFPAEQKVCDRFDLYSDIDDLMRVKHLLYLLTRCISCDIFGFVQACHYYRTYSNDEAYGKLAQLAYCTTKSHTILQLNT